MTIPSKYSPTLQQFQTTMGQLKSVFGKKSTHSPKIQLGLGQKGDIIFPLILLKAD